MVMILRSASAALVGGLAFAFVISSTGAVWAQGLFDFLFNPYPYSSRSYDRVPPNIKIKGPRYYTYSPDRVVTVSFRDLVEALSADTLEPALRETRFARARELLHAVKVRTFRPVAKAISAHYAKHPKFIWIEGDAINKKARAALAVLEAVDKFGLSPNDYQLNPRTKLAATGGGTELKALVQIEVELSAKVLTYALDAKRGRIDPNRISGYHDFIRKDVDLVSVMRSLSESDDTSGYITRLNPDNAHFKALVQELARLRAEVKREQITIAPDILLRPGGVSSELVRIVAAIRQRGTEKLKKQHSAILAQYAGGEDYSPELVALVRGFQRENGLQADGIVGRNTIRALVPMRRQEKIARVELAMERLRWLPQKLGSRYVFINQPSFVATYVNGGEELLTMRAIVGKKSNQTSVFVDKIETVEYSPYWGVPLSIIVNEMLPRLSRDPSYLDRLGYEVTTPSGRHVPSYSVNWYAVATKRTAINVRQPPGPSNALGAVKILFPNKHAIYMHDTPNKDLFERDRRAFSHGCIRLAKPRAMAAAVLGRTTSYVDRRIAEGQNNREDLSESIPIYVSYFTAWPDPKGQVQYFEDLYDRDVYLIRAIERTEAARQAAG